MMRDVACSGRSEVISALGLALSEIFEPQLRRALVLGLVIAAAVLLALLVVFGLLLHRVDLGGGWLLGGAVELLGDLAMLVLAWLLFPVVATTVLGFFLDAAIDSAERRHYPALPRARPVTFAAQLRSGLRLALLGVALNLLALPLYLFLPGINLLLFYGLNGWLLGREYFELVALRRLDEAELRVLWRAQWPRLVAAGVVIAVLMTVPLLNLAAPLIAALFMLHLFQGLRQGRREFLLTS